MDVQELLDQWQASAAWHADSISPDVASLAAWMAGQLGNTGGLKLTRSRSADPLYDLVVAYLAGQGVNVRHALQRAEDGRQAQASRVRADAAGIKTLAFSLKRAESELLAESAGFNEGATGFTSARLGEARERVDRLTAELRAACLDDPALARAARRAAG